MCDSVEVHGAQFLTIYLNGWMLLDHDFIFRIGVIITICINMDEMMMIWGPEWMSGESDCFENSNDSVMILTVCSDTWIEMLCVRACVCMVCMYVCMYVCMHVYASSPAAPVTTTVLPVKSVPKMSCVAMKAVHPGIPNRPSDSDKDTLVVS